MMTGEEKKEYWYVVRECLIAFHGVSKSDANRMALSYWKEIESAEPEIKIDVFYQTSCSRSLATSAAITWTWTRRLSAFTRKSGWASPLRCADARIEPRLTPSETQRPCLSSNPS